MKEKGAEIVVYRNTGGKNQHWKFHPYEPSRKEDPEEDQAAVERPTEEEQVEQQKSYAEQLSGRKSPTTEKHPLLQKEDEEEEKRRLFVTPVRVAVVVICLVGVLVLLLSFSVVFYYEDVSLSDKDRSKGKNITAESNVSLSRPQMLTGLNGYLSGSVGPGVVDETPSQPEVPQRQAAAAPDKQPAKLVPRRPETDRPAFRKPTNASSDRSEETEATRQADGPSELRERLAWLNASEAEVTAPPEATTEGYLQPEVTTSWPEFLPDIDLKQPEKPSRR